MQLEQYAVLVLSFQNEIEIKKDIEKSSIENEK